MQSVHIITENELEELKKYLEQIDIENGSILNNPSKKDLVLEGSQTIAHAITKIQKLISD